MDPTLEEIARAATALGFNLTERELVAYQSALIDMLTSYERLRELRALHEKADPHSRRYWMPGAGENQFGAWLYRAEIPPSAEGILTGKAIALKDNISIAGLPMTIGSGLLDGYLADVDATVVTRILGAGGTIAGTAVCESFCLSGGSHTSNSGPVRNPHMPSHSAGGSSSGNAALLASGAVDMAVGSDQGGSIRIPSAWCGVYGLKPTYGLVPYTGAASLDVTLDHLGPMARTVEDVAVLLDAIAGPDGIDPRQSAHTSKVNYSEQLKLGAQGLRIGVVDEGFSWPDRSQWDVDQCVREAADSFRKLGCDVRPISVPWHRDAQHLYLAILVDGWSMVAANSAGGNSKGLYLTNLTEAYVARRASGYDEFPENVKQLWVAGQYIQNRYRGLYYGIAHNLARSLSAAYDEVFLGCDLLIMPTSPYSARPLPSGVATIEEEIAETSGMECNVCAFDVTGHPAMNVPCGMVGGLPVGMMLVGRTNEDATVLRAAAAFEREIYSPRFPLS